MPNGTTNGTINGTTENKLLDLLIQNPGIKTADAAQALQISKRSCYRLLNKLESEDKIKRKGNRKDRYWEVKTENIITFQRIAAKDSVLPNGSAIGSTIGSTGNIQSELLDLLKKKPNIKASEMAKVLNISVRSCYRLLDKLKKEGKIERKGSRKGGCWIVHE